jgi:hypothetical protein
MDLRQNNSFRSLPKSANIFDQVIESNEKLKQSLIRSIQRQGNTFIKLHQGTRRIRDDHKGEVHERLNL